MSLWISLSAFFYFYEHFSLKVFMKLDHGRSKYQKRHFCVATLYIYFWFICSAPPCLIIILTIPHPAQYQPQFHINFQVATPKSTYILCLFSFLCWKQQVQPQGLKHVKGAFTHIHLISYLSTHEVWSIILGVCHPPTPSTNHIGL